MERAVPTMASVDAAGKITDAILDVTCWFPGCIEWFAFDVTVRYPGSQRYVGAPWRKGEAAAAGENDKFRRYGQEVLPLAFETGGRLGSASIQSLQRLALAACSSSVCALTYRGLVNRWRRRLEAALFFFAGADVILAATQASGGPEHTAALPTMHHSTARPTAAEPVDGSSACIPDEEFSLEAELEDLVCGTIQLPDSGELEAASWLHSLQDPAGGADLSDFVAVL